MAYPSVSWAYVRISTSMPKFARGFSLVDALDADGLKRQEAIDKAIRAVERHGMTYADAGDVVGYSAAWVSDRIAEYRDGEHGDPLNEASA